MACITEAAIGFPNGSGTIPLENGMLSEILGERGWNTYMVGKWVDLLSRTGMGAGELGGVRDDAMYRVGDTWWFASRSANCTTTATSRSTRCWLGSLPTIRLGADRLATVTGSNAKTGDPPTGAPSTARCGCHQTGPHPKGVT